MKLTCDCIECKQDRWILKRNRRKLEASMVAIFESKTQPEDVIPNRVVSRTWLGDCS